MRITFLLILLFHLRPVFSQISINETEGFKDTSNYSDLRRRIDMVSMFIKIDSSDATAYFRRASLKYQVGEYQRCIDDINIILRRFPEHAADAYTNRGMCYCFMKQLDLGISDLQKARMLDPKDAKAYLNLAFAYDILANNEQAILYLDTAISLRPDYAKAYANRGTSKKMLKKFNEAIEDYNKAIAINPDYFEAYLLRGDAKASLDKFDDGIADLNTALRIEPKLNGHDFYMWRSAIYDKKGDKVNAKADLEKAESFK